MSRSRSMRANGAQWQVLMSSSDVGWRQHWRPDLEQAFETYVSSFDEGIRASVEMLAEAQKFKQGVLLDPRTIPAAAVFRDDGKVRAIAQDVTVCIPGAWTFQPPDNTKLYREDAFDPDSPERDGPDEAVRAWLQRASETAMRGRFGFVCRPVHMLRRGRLWERSEPDRINQLVAVDASPSSIKCIRRRLGLPSFAPDSILISEATFVQAWALLTKGKLDGIIERKFVDERSRRRLLLRPSAGVP